MDDNVSLCECLNFYMINLKDKAVPNLQVSDVMNQI